MPLTRLSACAPFLALAAALFCRNAPAAPAATAGDPPLSWIDPDTGHRVIRLSREPGTASLYFNVSSYTPDGKKLVVSTPEGIATITLQSGELSLLIPGRVAIVGVGRKSGQIYYVKGEAADRSVYMTSELDGSTRKIASLGPNETVATVNADETLIAGTTAEHRSREWPAGGPPQAPTPSGLAAMTSAQRKDWSLGRRLAEHLPMTLFTIEIASGKRKTLLSSTDWLNHLQFSPVDPSALVFCHEGPWQAVDRLWMIRSDGSGLTKIHERTMSMEIAGHEFWSADGKTIWYDLQTPRGEDFWLAGYRVDSGKRIRYHLQRNEWSVHYNVSPDGTLFAGDGGDNEMVAHAPDGKWIYLFRPTLLPIWEAKPDEDASKLIEPGVFTSERLVNMKDHKYSLEPNVSFSPDMKWIIFRSNMFGPTHTFAVELKKSS